MNKKIKRVLIFFSIAFIISLSWSIFKYYNNFGIPGDAIEIDLNQPDVLVEKKYNMANNECYLVGLWSNGDVFDGKYHFDISKNKLNYPLNGEYKLSYYSGDKLIHSKNITKDNLTTISMNGSSRSSKICFDRIKAPLKGKYNKLKVKLEIKNLQGKFRTTSQNTYFFIEKVKCPSSFWMHKAELRKKKSLFIDNKETNTTLIPLYNALKDKNTAKVQELINNGISPQAKMLGDRKPIHYATFFNDENTLKYLISKRVDLNEKDTFRKTPLHYGIENNATKTVKLLLENGADLGLVVRVDDYLKIVDWNKQIAVITYVSASYLLEMTEILLKHKLNPNYTYNNYPTRLTAFKYDKIVNDNLTRYGDKPKYPDYEKMINLLRAYGAKTTDELKNMKEISTNKILIKKDK